MAQKKRYSVKVPTFTYSKCLATNKCESRYLLTAQHKLDSCASLVKRQIRSRQASLLKRFNGLCGSDLLQMEIDKLDQKIEESCPRDILSADGILLEKRVQSSKSAETITCSRIQRSAHESSRKTRPTTDLGAVNSKGFVEIGEYTRPLYPWETVGGMQWLKSLGSTILQTPQKSDTTQATHTKVNKEKVQKLADTSEPPVCREASTSNEQEPLIDISRVITRYEDQHQKIFIRNHLQRKKRILLTRYNALFLEENLRRFKSCEGVHKQSEGNEDEQTTSPIRINISPVSKVERTTKLIKEKEVLACTALKLPPIPEQSTVATLQLVSS